MKGEDRFQDRRRTGAEDVKNTHPNKNDPMARQKE